MRDIFYYVLGSRFIIAFSFEKSPLPFDWKRTCASLR